MASYFDDLVLDLTYLIVSYLDKPTDLNKLIDLSSVLKNRFQEDEAWKIMFYHNIKNPVISTNILYRDNYYINMNIKSKYDIIDVKGLENSWNYIIFNLDKLKNDINAFILRHNSSRFKNKFVLKFIIDNGNIKYFNTLNNFDVNTILNHLGDLTRTNGINFGFEIEANLFYGHVVDFLDYFGANDKVDKIFHLNNMIYAYKNI